MGAISLKNNSLFTSSFHHKWHGVRARQPLPTRCDIDEATRRFNAEVMPVLMQRIRGLKVSESRVKALKNVLDEHLAMRPPVPDSPGFSEVDWNMLDKWHQDAWKALRRAEEDIQTLREVIPWISPLTKCVARVDCEECLLGKQLH